MNIRQLDLRKLNSITKYPSILTYHVLGDKGKLLPQTNLSFLSDSAYGTEKVDGTNGRIVVMPDGEFIIGSREDFLYGKGDLIVNQTLNIVPTVLDAAYRITKDKIDNPEILVYYMEIYGHSVGAGAKQYAKGQINSFRLFDVACIPLTRVQELLAMELPAIAAWRDNGGQAFLNTIELVGAANAAGIQRVPDVEIEPPPEDLMETLVWLKKTIPQSLCSLDAGAGLRPEGIVVRNFNRTKIAKIRFEDYERTAKAMGWRETV